MCPIPYTAQGFPPQPVSSVQVGFSSGQSGGGTALVKLCTGERVKTASRASEANSFMGMAPDLFCDLLKISVYIRHVDVYIRHMEATHMNCTQAMAKLESAKKYLSHITRYANTMEGEATDSACNILTAAYYEARFSNENRVCGRRAAAKYGKQCSLTLLAGTHPYTHIIETDAIYQSIALACKAARNAFWAHPELREVA
jgi:hypothetical protein